MRFWHASLIACLFCVFNAFADEEELLFPEPRLFCQRQMAAIARRLPRRAPPPTATTTRTIATLRALMNRLVDKSATPEEGLADRTGNCYDCSGRVQQVLRAAGMEPQRVYVDYEMSVMNHNMQVIDLEAYHFYSILPAERGRDEIIICSTYLQFFRGSDKIEAPSVFVGTREQLIAFFERHADKLDMKFGVHGEGFAQHRPLFVDEFVDRMFGLGEFSSERKTRNIRRD